MLRQIEPDRELFDADGRFIPRSYNHGRGLYADHLGVSVPIDFRFYVRRAAQVAGTTMSDLIRQSVEARAAAILSGRGGDQ